MFTEQFNLSRLPFEERISLDRILRDERFVQALARLEYFSHDGSVALISGPSGVGKSSLLKLFVDSLPTHRYQPLWVPLSTVDSTAMLRMIVSALGEKPKMGKDRLFGQIVQKVQISKQIVVIIADDAHLLAESTLTDLRLLVSAPLSDGAEIKLLLCGQAPLGKLLSRQMLADLLNRISVRYHLRAFNPDETTCYIDQRLKSCEGKEEIFDHQAKNLIHEYTGGIPRQINNLATVCLIHAASKGIKRINETLVKAAAAELRLL